MPNSPAHKECTTEEAAEIIIEYPCSLGILKALEYTLAEKNPSLNNQAALAVIDAGKRRANNVAAELALVSIGLSSVIGFGATELCKFIIDPLPHQLNEPGFLIPQAIVGALAMIASGTRFVMAAVDIVDGIRDKTFLKALAVHEMLGGDLEALEVGDVESP